jgi:hypothetical protein
MDTDLEKLRRFCITAALVLITYLLADIIIKPNAELKVFDLPLIVTRSELLPVGVAIACFLGMIRFTFYGFVINNSPFRKRRDLMDSIEVYVSERPRNWPEGYLPPISLAKEHITYGPGRSLWMYFGLSKLRLNSYNDSAFESAVSLASTFPRLRTARAYATKDGSADGDGLMVIPFRCRMAAFFEDIDYSAPVWLSAIALIMFFWPLIRRLVGRVV